MFEFADSLADRAHQGFNIALCRFLLFAEGFIGRFEEQALRLLERRMRNFFESVFDFLTQSRQLFAFFLHSAFALFGAGFFAAELGFGFFQTRLQGFALLLDIVGAHFSLFALVLQRLFQRIHARKIGGILCQKGRISAIHLVEAFIALIGTLAVRPERIDQKPAEKQGSEKRYVQQIKLCVADSNYGHCHHLSLPGFGVSEQNINVFGDQRLLNGTGFAPIREDAQEVRPSHKNLPRVRPAVQLAQEVGTRLGRGRVLF